jgi:hypothetical protein
MNALSLSRRALPPLWHLRACSVHAFISTAARWTSQSRACASARAGICSRSRESQSLCSSCARVRHRRAQHSRFLRLAGLRDTVADTFQSIRNARSQLRPWSALALAACVFIDHHVRTSVCVRSQWAALSVSRESPVLKRTATNHTGPAVALRIV